MAGLPTVQVLLDDGTGTFPYDITTKARVQYTASRGRQNEQSNVTPGQITLTLDNNDGRFTVGSTVIASPSPILANQRIRVKVTANAVTTTRFTGYVQQWPVEWPSGSDVASLVSVVATDAQARAERRILRSVPEEEIMADSPAAYYTLGEPDGATAAGDSSGNQQSVLTMVGTGTAVVFGTATGPGTDGLTAAQFAGGQGLVGSTTITAGVLECAFSISAAPATTPVVIMALGNAAIGVHTDGKVHTNGTVDLASGPVVTDGLTHTLSWQSGHAILDGVDIGSPTYAPTSGGLAVGASGLYGGNLGAQGSNAFTGAIAHIAAFASLSTTRATAHGTAESTGFAGESGTARLTRLAGYGSIPIGTFDTSLTNVAFKDATGQSAAQALRDVADAEVGLVFFDGSGNLTFHNRNRAPAKTAPDVTLTAIDLDPGTRFDYDTQGLLNYFEATAAGTKATQVARNTASETRHGRYTGSASYLVQTDAEALDRGNWIVGTHADPSPRIGSLVIDLLSQTAATQAALLAAEPNTWIRVTGLPSQTPGGTTADLVVQGFTDTLTKDSWSITFNVINRSLVQAWILGDSTLGVLGTTTRLYV